MAMICGSFLYLRYSAQIHNGTLIGQYSRLCLLTVERIDLASRQHVREHEVLKHLDPLRGSCLVVVPERLKEVFACALPLTFGCCGLMW